MDLAADMPETAPDAPRAQDAYGRLLEAIRSGALTPGARLRETELATRLGISRTPVREAIRRLEAEGLVVHLPRRGATLRRLDHAEVMELYEWRTVIEGTAARLAARAASDIELDELRAIQAEMDAAGSAVLRARLNRQFHATLLHAARNRFVAEAMAAIGRTLLILGPSTLEDSGRARQAGAEHAELLAALAARDGAAAEAAMRRHIEAAQVERLRRLRAAALDEAVDAGADAARDATGAPPAPSTPAAADG